MRNLWNLHEIVLLRWSQLGVLLCGLLLIMIGVGIHAPWLRTCLQLAVTGAVAGLVYERLLRQRGESDGAALWLPLASGVSGMAALLTAV